MCHTPSSGPDYDDVFTFVERFGSWSPTEWQKRIIQDILELHDKDPEAFRRERLNRWTHDDPDEPDPAEDVNRRLAKGVGVYNQMIRRETGGSDPLVEEPGP